MDGFYDVAVKPIYFDSLNNVIDREKSSPNRIWTSIKCCGIALGTLSAMILKLAIGTILFPIIPISFPIFSSVFKYEPLVLKSSIMVAILCLINQSNKIEGYGLLLLGKWY